MFAKLENMQNYESHKVSFNSSKERYYSFKSVEFQNNKSVWDKDVYSTHINFAQQGSDKV